MKAARRGVPLTVAAASVLLLAACSSSESGDRFGMDRGDGAASTADLSGDELAELAMETLADAEAVRFATPEGTSVDGVTLDLHVDRSGACTGTIGQEGIGSFEFLKRGDDVWMKPDEGFLGLVFAQEMTGLTEAEVQEAEEAAVAALDGRYLYGSATENPELMGGVGDFCAMDSLLEDLEDMEPAGDEADAQPATREDSTHEGEPVVRIETVDSSGDRLVLLVAAEGEPYPLLLIGEMDGVRGKLGFSEFNEPVVFEEPTESESLSTLEYRTSFLDELINGGQIAG